MAGDKKFNGRSGFLPFFLEEKPCFDTTQTPHTVGKPAPVSVVLSDSEVLLSGYEYPRVILPILIRLQLLNLPV
jgi:hypothetical protein